MRFNPLCTKGNVEQAQIRDTVLSAVISIDHLNASADMVQTTLTLRKTCVEESNSNETP